MNHSENQTPPGAATPRSTPHVTVPSLTLRAGIRGRFTYHIVHSAIAVLLETCGAARADDQPQVYATPEEAAASPDFGLQGEYVADDRCIQVVAQGDGEFLVVLYRGGLPGAGWDGSEREDFDEDAEGVAAVIEGFEKITRESPTLGAEAPEGAVVLFDGTPETHAAHWQQGSRLTDDGLLMEGSDSIDVFEDCTLHIEFRLPFEPFNRGQGRANSGCYLQKRFEVQMLDSFGLEGLDNECGGLYSIKKPDVNMCLPPLSWQTYDIDFTAARYDEAGNKTANARMTVRHNGVVIHQDVELDRSTPVGDPEGNSPGPLHLQNHGNAVRYRNIWVVLRDAEAQARRPIVPGFERFHAVAGGDALAGGELLLGELNCTACHAVSDAIAARLIRRQAPVLDQVGSRAKPEWMRDYLLNPHAMKPGTTMPDLLARFPEAERQAAAIALTNFLVSTGNVSDQRGDRQAVQRGEALFHEVGCTACHQPQQDSDVDVGQSMPLTGIDQKYTILSLREFMKDPHRSRPSGRMPAFNLNDEQATDIASYLLRDAVVISGPPSLNYAAYEGDWGEVPDFDDLTPVSEGTCSGLDLNVAGRSNNFGIEFNGWLKIDQPGEYRFHLSSDDGSMLSIDGEEVIDNNGIHARETREKSIELTAGMHAIRVTYIQGGGEWNLDLEYEGPDLPRQSAERAFYLDESGVRAPVETPEALARFDFDPSLVQRGRELFASLGCASCHDLQRDGGRIASLVQAKPLAECAPGAGCLASESDEVVRPVPASPIPQNDLSLEQRQALNAVTVASAASDAILSLTSSETIQRTMVAFNCYACHSRGEVGGPTRDRNGVFTSTIPEMGDEGRIPPPLDGVGDKLSDGWLRHILQNGADDRPYMRAQMPKFASDDVTRLAEAFVALDRAPETDWAQTLEAIPEPDHRISSTGRHLVGGEALACIKCHTFGDFPATGIQAINLQTMSRRLRQDWFMRYLFDPQQFRPGTRMPTGYPEGVATVTDIYDGNPQQQILAMWVWLSEGDKAGIPDGVLHDPIELVPEDRPIIYRNFLDGLSPRGIAVGYPELAHFAWDANDMCLKLIWHGRFIDASLHWVGRGPGNQRPLGDHVMRFEESMPIAALGSLMESWPTTSARERGAAFEGYKLDASGRPAFHYTIGDIDVVDFPMPSKSVTDVDAGFERVITVSSPQAVENLYFRAATGQIVAQDDGSYLVDDAVNIAITLGGEPILRDIDGHQELLVPIALEGGSCEVRQVIKW